MTPPRKYEEGKGNPFGRLTVADVDVATYGETASDLPDSKKMVARAIEIDRIQPDPRQPRRVLPAEVRRMWDGNPGALPRVLRIWQELVERKLGQALNVPEMILGAAERDQANDDAFMMTVSLAATIYKDGLENPIRVTRGGTIESGERRWLAYWLLHLAGLGEYSRIPAFQKQEIDVWAQAAENGARSPLNAIGMARQLALLIMDMYEHDDGIVFDAYETLVLPGAADRRFYAQVSNGQIYRIKRGMGERVLQVTGLKSKDQISQYRALLSIPDGLWVKADEQDWSEFQIREYAASANTGSREDAGESDGDRLTAVSLSSESGAYETPPAPADSPPRTSIGERLGLYGQPKTSPPKSRVGVTGRIQTSEDEYKDSGARTDPDDDWENETRTALKGIEEDLRPPVIESTVPIADDDAWADVAAVLRFVKSSTKDPQLKGQMTELLTMSRNDIRAWLTMGGQQVGWWGGLLEQRQALIHRALDGHKGRVTELLEHLLATGEEFAKERKQ
ncbi:MAG: ParB/RepB/Spo0J family partition protein [Anaerolineae bacterium]|nr:ParB/RepB/Spo0J family partition protein [Anaerolineae bacterium]NUQ06373.1 ParB/RepB/Spo0J family partition protein [Anaerolineae bacterium]